MKKWIIAGIAGVIVLWWYFTSRNNSAAVNVNGNTPYASTPSNIGSVLSSLPASFQQAAQDLGVNPGAILDASPGGGSGAGLLQSALNSLDLATAEAQLPKPGQSGGFGNIGGSTGSGSSSSSDDSDDTDVTDGDDDSGDDEALLNSTGDYSDTFDTADSFAYTGDTASDDDDDGSLVPVYSDDSGDYGGDDDGGDDDGGDD